MSKNKSLIQQFLKYLARPRIEVEEKPPLQIIIFNVVRLWALVFFLSLFFAMISNFVLGEVGYSEEDFAITKILVDFPTLLIFFLVVIWAPISEEIAFRLWLRFSPINWALGLSFLIFFTVSFLNFSFIPQNLFTFNSWLGISSTILLLLFLTLFIYKLLSSKKIASSVEKFFRKNFRILFYILALSFAFLHIPNYDIDFRQFWYFAPILVAPQILLSFTISFVRMQYGFIWALFTHMLNNIAAITPLLFILPLLEGFDDASLENMEIFETLSLSEIALIMIASMFLLLIFLVCFLSIFSLLFEMLRKN